MTRSSRFSAALMHTAATLGLDAVRLSSRPARGPTGAALLVAAEVEQ
jgi:hypothetical protein